MANRMKLKRVKTLRRAARVRARVRGTASAPRLSVKRSLKHLYAQVIDDTTGRTLAAVSDREIKEAGKPVVLAKAIGKLLAEKATKAGITNVVFDRGPYRYHGRVAALADGAREGGLQF
jgi:large subunit ribosomal protein L18